MWPVQMLQQPVEATATSRQATQLPRQAITSGIGQGDALALTNATAASSSAAPATPGSPTSTAATEVIVVNDPIQILPRDTIPGPLAVTNSWSPTSARQRPVHCTWPGWLQGPTVPYADANFGLVPKKAPPPQLPARAAQRVRLARRRPTLPHHNWHGG